MDGYGGRKKTPRTEPSELVDACEGARRASRGHSAVRSRAGSARAARHLHGENDERGSGLHRAAECCARSQGEIFRGRSKDSVRTCNENLQVDRAHDMVCGRDRGSSERGEWASREAAAERSPAVTTAAVSRKM